MKAVGFDVLIVFTRFPRAGTSKTRLIPSLGAEGAAALQRRMTRHLLGRAWAWKLGDDARQLRVAWEGGSLREMRDWLGPFDFVPQGEGDLGERMERCLRREFAGGARSVVLVGTDCPRLDETGLTEALRALELASVVFGPAEDGGYYLIGMTQPVPGLFSGMQWSTSWVLEESCRRVRAQGIEPLLLRCLPDVDLPPDLADAEVELNRGASVSVIVPALNEAENLTCLLPLLCKAQPREILIADGGSSDSSAAVAAAHGARFIPCERGRARQMNAAAARAEGEYLLFLHADTLPPDDFCRIIAASLEGGGVAAGAFSFALREPLWGKSWIEKLVALRCALWRLPYGDQGLFLRRSVFHSVGGFPDWLVLEDVEIVMRLRARGRMVITQEKALTSARRWREGGAVSTFWRHQRILLGHRFGVPTGRLAGWR